MLPNYKVELTIALLVIAIAVLFITTTSLGVAIARIIATNSLAVRAIALVFITNLWGELGIGAVDIASLKFCFENRTIVEKSATLFAEIVPELQQEKCTASGVCDLQVFAVHRALQPDLLQIRVLGLGLAGHSPHQT